MTDDLWIDDISLHSLSVKRSDIKLTSVVWIVAYYARMKLPQDSHNLLNSESFAPSPIRGLGAQSTADTDTFTTVRFTHYTTFIFSPIKLRPSFDKMNSNKTKKISVHSMH